METESEPQKSEFLALPQKVRAALWFAIYVSGICYYVVLSYLYGDINFRPQFTLNPLVYLVSLGAPWALTAERIEELLNAYFRHPGGSVYDFRIAGFTAAFLYIFHLALSLYLKKLWLFVGMLGILMLLLVWNTSIVMQIITD